MRSWEIVNKFVRHLTKNSGSQLEEVCLLLGFVVFLFVLFFCNLAGYKYLSFQVLSNIWTVYTWHFICCCFFVSCIEINIRYLPEFMKIYSAIKVIEITIEPLDEIKNYVPSFYLSYSHLTTASIEYSRKLRHYSISLPKWGNINSQNIAIITFNNQPLR